MFRLRISSYRATAFQIKFWLIKQIITFNLSAKYFAHQMQRILYVRFISIKLALEILG